MAAEGVGQVTFDDAAIYFSEEQWGNLEEVQKKVYKELIKEIYEIMLSLGYCIPKPEIVSRIERGEDPYGVVSKKQKLQEPQPEGLPTAGSKESEPEVKTERQSPIPCNTVRPGEISSSQEKGDGAQCQNCGTHCNNQCGLSFQWNAQRAFHGSPGDRSQGKRYVAPQPLYFSGNPTSPSYANNANGMIHPTSPVASYGNSPMGPLSPHCPGYRIIDPSAPFAGPERLGNPMFGNFETGPQSSLGSAGSNLGNLEHETRNRREQFPREPPYVLHAPPFQERRNSGMPCAGCGSFCNNQCPMSLQRMLQPAPVVVDGHQGNRYTSPPNPYFNAPSSHFANGRPGMRYPNPPGMAPISPQFPGYRRPGDQTGPNMVRGRSENPAASLGSNAANGFTQGANKLPAASSGNQRRAQAMSPLAPIEPVPVPSTSASPGAVHEQRNRHSMVMITSTENPRDKMPSNTSKKPENWRFSVQGGNMAPRAGQPVAQQQMNKTIPQRVGEAANNRSYFLSDNKASAAKNAKQTSSGAVVLETGYVALTASGGSSAIKRPTPPIPSDVVQPLKRASPLSVHSEGPGGKRATPPGATGNQPSTSSTTPPINKPINLVTSPIIINDDHDVKRTTPTETKDGKSVRRNTPPITISRIRNAGVFLPPQPKTKSRETSNSTPEIIIIDDKDPKTNSPHKLPENFTSKEVRSSANWTPQSSNSKGNGDILAASSLQKTQTQSGAVLVNKVQVQQPAPIIVTGSPGMANQPLPVAVNGNQSIMLTFPVTMGSSGIMLATPMNIGENQIAGVKQSNRVPISKNPRFVPNHTVPLNTQPANAKFAPMAVTPIMGQANRVPVPLQSNQPKPITVNVSQPAAHIAGSLNVQNNLPQVTSGAINAVPVKASGNQAIGQPYPLFVDAHSGIILTAPTVPSKDAVPPGIGNTTVVTVNGNVVTGNVAPMALGGKLAFSNIAPVNVNGGLGIGNTATFIAVDGALGIPNGTPVTITSNATAINNTKATLSMNNPTILTVNSGLGIRNTAVIGTPVGNITHLNANGPIQVGQPSTSTVLNADQQNTGIVIRKVNETAGPVVQHTLANTNQTPIAVERLFKCSQCEERFSSLETLTSHQKVHEGANSTAESAQQSSKDPSEAEDAGGVTDEDAPKILYTTQGDDGSTVYVVTV
ncbi:hypothetical protein XENTR_v10015691 [Xenopus tropicalis]|uniref:Uncharacterized protein LOC100486247 n=1 Tax=Xenopus tropicalis TaxID=8364 RepID=A0A6I8R6X0_XENTR|nr:uncharacterized protein LOC100486247 [Xenopus tropicalis]KAE8595310.1 hypothetical protein XENTR_v10015691 [Xenopus tropicalis]|eukprot:XP_002942025.1 PREDICTED: uncharacterized protein LOC100486247 [Xenopus tropicalis]